MDVIKSNIDTKSEKFRKNKSAYLELLKSHKSLEKRAKQGGSPSSKKSHLSKGKDLNS